MTDTSASFSNFGNGGLNVNRAAKFVRAATAILLSGLLTLQPILANAQSVSAAGSAPSANQPGVGAAPNGVPLVDIVTPNSAGLSHNKYDNFNVGTPGLILNNFSGEVGMSNLGGVTPGNANLKNSGPASVILNEVTSGNRSALEGPTEVFGGRADVIIANPNGITCNGCGFFNTPRATLTTGTPDIGSDGRLAGFGVTRGDVTFEGAGANLAASPGAVDLFDVVSRQIHVNAPLYGKTIRLTGGASKYDYATGEATSLTATSGTPEYAIDGSALGAMQADRIKIVVTEKGAGVKMSGDMAANAGELTLSADGKISIGNASARDGVTLTSKRQVTAARVTTKQKVKVQADAGITLQSVAADSDIELLNGAGLLSVVGDVNSGTTVVMSAIGGITAGSVTAGNGAATLNATSGDIAIAGAAISTGGLTLTASHGAISAASLQSNQNIALNAGLEIAVAGNVLAEAGISASGRSLSAGLIVSGIDIAATSADPNGHVVLGNAGDLSLTAVNGSITTGNLLSAGSLGISATGNVTAGSIQSAKSLTISAASFSATGMTSHGALAVTASSGGVDVSGQVFAASNVLISGSAIQASAIVSGVDFAATSANGGSLVVGSAGTLDLSADAGIITVDTLLSAGDLTAKAALLQSTDISSHGNVEVDGGVGVTGQLLSAGPVTINGNANGVSAGLLASGVDFAATKAAGGNIVVASSADLTISNSAGAINAGTVLSAGVITAVGQTITADTVTGHGDVSLVGIPNTLAGSGGVKIAGQVLGGGNVSIAGSAIAADAIVSGVDIAATDAAGGKVVLGASTAGTGNLTLTANGALSAGALLSSGVLSANAATIAAGSISAHGDMTIAGVINVTDQILGGRNVLISGQSLAAQALVAGINFDASDAAGGNIVLGQTGDLNVSVSGAVAAPTVQAAGTIDVTAASVSAGTITGHKDITLAGASRGVTIANQVLGGSDISVSGSSIQAGTIVSGVDFSATNAAGGAIMLAPSGATNLTASGDIAAGTVAAAGDITAAAVNLKADSITGHGNVGIAGSVDVSNQIIASGNLTLNGGHIKAPTLISGIDFAATNAAGGTIVLGTVGEMNLTATASIDAQSMLSAAAINASGGTITADAMTGHGDITLAGSSSVKITGQLIAAGDVLLSGSTVQINQAISGVDFTRSAQSSNGAIALGEAGDLNIKAASATAGTLIVAGGLDIAASAFTSGNITGHSAVLIGSSASPGTVAINGQLLGAGNVSITGSAVNGNVIAAGVDFAATDRSGAGSVILGQTGALRLTATAGDISFNSLLAAGTITANAANTVSANVVSHGDLAITADNGITLTGQSLASRNADLSARSMTIDTLISGVDFAATKAATGGSLMLQRSGAMTLSASNGSIIANSLVSGGNLAATAMQNIRYNSLQSLGSATLTAQGTIAYTNTTRVGGNLTLNTAAVDLSGSRGSQMSVGGTLIVNGASANLSGSNLVFGGLSLNLSGSADLSNAEVRTVTNAGGSGDIAIAAAGLTSNANTSLLAAHDLTLSLPSLANAGQLAAGNNLTFNVGGDFSNSASGLVFANGNANFFIGGVLTNDAGAIFASHNFAIQGTAPGQRNGATINVSGLLQAGGDMSILTSNLTNKRSTTPTWVTGQLVSSGGVVGTFVLNPDVAGKPFAYLETVDENTFQLYPGIDPPSWQDYQPQLWSQATLADGTSYHAWTWISGNGPTEVRPIYNWIKDRVPKDANGNPVLDPNNPSKYFIVDNVVRGGSDTSTTYTWDPTAKISQSVYEDRFTSALTPEAVIRSGGNLTVDATNLTNSYSRIEAGGNASFSGSTLTNEGVALNRTTTLTCTAQSACTAFNADGTADPSRDIANGTSIASGTETIGGAAGIIKAAGSLAINYATINNTSAAGSIAGQSAVNAPVTQSNPLSALNGMTAGGALFNVNAALAGVSANGGAVLGSGPSLDGGITASGAAAVNAHSLIGKLTTAIGNSGNLVQILQANGTELAALSKPQSGGVGMTVPGQVFLFETRAAFLDVSTFYGSGYFINRIGYTPDTKVPFLGDAYFDNQIVDEQMRQLVGDGLGAGSFIPGNGAIDQMKTLLDNGVAYMQAHGLALGQALTPEQAASLTQSMVIYQAQTIDGAQVLVPVVYLSAEDRAKVNGSGATIAGNTVKIDGGSVNNSGAIAAADGLTINATEIKSNGGIFYAGGNVNLTASNGITLAAQTMTIGGQSLVNTNVGVSAGGNIRLAANNSDLNLNGASVKAGGSAQLSGNNVNLAAVKVDNSGQQNATGARVTAGSNLAIAANNDVNVIGSSAKSGGDLNIKATNGAVNVVSTDVARKTNDGYTKTSGTDQQASQLTAGGNLSVNGNNGVLISGSDLSAKGDVGLRSNGDINVTTAQSQSASTFGKGASSSITNNGSTITAGGDLVAKSNNDINVIGSTMAADGMLGLQAKNNVTIAEATDGYTLDVKSSTKKSGFLGSTKENASGHLETTTAAGSTLSGKDSVTIISGGDTTVSASKVTAGDATQSSDLNIQTGGNLIVASAKDTETENDSAKRKGFLRSGSSNYQGYNETTVGSELSASGDVNLDAGKAAVIVGSKVNADGSLSVSGESVSIIGAEESHQSDSQRKDSGLFVGSGGGFISLYGKNEKQGAQSSTDNVGSKLSAGQDVNLTARATDLNIMGSQVNADRDINLSAVRDVNVTPGAESAAQSEEQKNSGFGLAFSSGNGGFSLGIGAQSTKDSTAQQSDTNAMSALSAGRDLNISAGNNVNLQATSASAERDVNLFAGNDINLLSANDVTNYEEMHEKTFDGVTLSVSSKVSQAAQSIMNSAERLSDSGGVNAVTNTAIAGLGFYQAYKDLTGVYDGLTTTDPLAVKGLAFSIGVNAGVSHQESKSSSTTSTPVVTDIRAGRSITMEAENGSITSDGAQIYAGYDKYGLPNVSGDPLNGDIFLSATNGDINLNAATGTSDTSSSNTSTSVGVGVDFGCNTGGGACSVNAGVNGAYGKGGSQTSGTTHTNTHINGTGDVTIVTNDLTLKGATITGNSVTADVKNLTIESQVDTQKASADQLNVSAQIGIGSANVSGVTQKGKGDAVVVTEQSGIHAGAGGLDIDVSGHTSLIGGLITSEATADKNHFETGTLTVADIDTHSTWKADTYGGSIGTGGLSLAPPVKAGENETGKALSAIGGNIPITITDPAHQTQDIGTIRRDTANTNTSLPGLPDLEHILRDQYKTQADLQEAQKTMAGLVGDIASDLYGKATTEAERDLWKEGGQGRALLQAIGGGILGGVNGWEGAIKGALGAGASSLMAPAIASLVKGMLKDSSLSAQDQLTLATLIGSSLSAGVGGAVGGGEGAAYGAANYQYNYLNHADNEALEAAKKACGGGKGDAGACKEQARLEATDKQQQDAMNACRQSGYQADGCGAVFASVVTALFSYGGTASWLLPADQYQEAINDLRVSGGLTQILKIMAPEGFANLPPDKQDEAGKLITLLTGDPSGIAVVPSIIAAASKGDPLALVQLITFITKFKGSGLGHIPESAVSDSNKIDNSFLDSTTASGDSVYQNAISTAIGDDIATKRNFYSAIDTGNGHNVIVHGGLNYDELGGVPFVNGRETNPAQIAEAVRSNSAYVEGTQVCFASCWSGTSGTAQQLASELNAPVFAPSRPVAWDSVSNNWIFDTDVFGINAVPHPEIKPTWQMFYPSRK
ncbi:hemagglutinin repeat-containing protein [Rhizobium tumorigenes]|uniref:Hemagglutinin repeat-containing protein n=1 Tax=Rhizobium tumorigenes TaxID=2041385 RepID=A0AAF1KJ40_9HYPH|nr:hemagglutinin repeat-containing protein [Rhizobium tumorigenes]WFR98777.1 hemagglutinin repeat-containing protein [Rhizobium tumorigenes]